jgi:hypothetical protein
MGIYIIPGIILLVIVILIIAWHCEKKRSEALAAVAKALNFSFALKGDASLLSRHQHFNLFSKGYSKKTKNVMVGKSGNLDITIMDYRYTVGGGKNSNTYSQTVIAVRSDLDLPSFNLGPEYLFHKIGSVFGYQDIDFNSHPDFSRQYLLRGPDEGAIREFFNAEMFEFFEQHEAVSVEAMGNEFISYTKDKKLAPKDIQAALQDAINFYGIMKRTHSGT